MRMLGGLRRNPTGTCSSHEQFRSVRSDSTVHLRSIRRRHLNRILVHENMQVHARMNFNGCTSSLAITALHQDIMSATMKNYGFVDNDHWIGAWHGELATQQLRSIDLNPRFDRLS